MVLIASACRLSARAVARQLRNGSARAFHRAPASLAAQNFNMPALSPTMTEGNIATWKVKEGDSFAAGDVLLEIETDKAQMDVEAQDDGIVAKIIQGDGAKSVQVGTRIAVMAEPGDDITSLELPAEDAAPKKEEGKQQAKQERAPSPTPAKPAQSSTPSQEALKSPGAKSQKQTYPLYPSVQHLLKINGLPKEEADKIPATGPSGRLLKGDVLAYLGHIQGSYITEQSQRINKLTHLDLSNVKVAAAKPAPIGKTPAPTQEPQAVVQEPDTEVAVTVSFKAVQEVQKRVQESLGVFLPLSTFIARASELANDDLPRSRVTKPTADELFDAVLGLDKGPGKQFSRGQFLPQVTALPPTTLQTSKAKRSDIFDELVASKTASPSKATRPAAGATGRVLGPVNVFSVSVPKGDERRAQVFLERVKLALEADPGRLIL